MGVCVGGCMGVRVGVGVRLCVMERGDGERVLRNNVRRIHGPQPTRFSPCVPTPLTPATTTPPIFQPTRRLPPSAVGQDGIPRRL